MALIRSGSSDSHLEVDTTSLAMRMTTYDSLGRVIARQGAGVFGVSAAFTPPATPQDLFFIAGSDSKVVRVYSIYLGTTNTAAGSQQYFLLKRSSRNIVTTVNFFTPVPLALDSKNAATSLAGHYITTATAAGNVGQLVGNINIVRWSSPLLSPGNFAGVVKETGREIMPWTGSPSLDKFIVLRGSNQLLAVNFAGAALVAGQIHTYRIIWTESDQ